MAYIWDLNIYKSASNKDGRILTRTTITLPGQSSKAGNLEEGSTDSTRLTLSLKLLIGPAAVLRGNAHWQLFEWSMKYLRRTDYLAEENPLYSKFEAEYFPLN